MKKSSLLSLVSYINGEAVDNIEEIKAEIEAVLSKGEAKAQANRELYAEAHDVIVDVMKKLTAPASVADIYAEAAPKLPDGMSKGKIQYAITRLWADEMDKFEGKVNTYSLKA